MIDRYVSLVEIKKGSLQLLGIAALYISAKLHEKMYIDEEPFTSSVRGANVKKLMEMEKNLLLALDFQVYSVVTTYNASSFTRPFLYLSRLVSLDLVARHVTFHDVARFIEHDGRPPQSRECDAIYHALANEVARSESTLKLLYGQAPSWLTEWMPMVDQWKFTTALDEVVKPEKSTILTRSKSKQLQTVTVSSHVAIVTVTPCILTPTLGSTESIPLVNDNEEEIRPAKRQRFNDTAADKVEEVSRREGIKITRPCVPARCQGKTGRGDRCKHWAQKNSNFCRFHLPTLK